MRKENQENDIIDKKQILLIFVIFFKNIRTLIKTYLDTILYIQHGSMWHEKTNDQTREKFTFFIYSRLGKGLLKLAYWPDAVARIGSVAERCGQNTRDRALREIESLPLQEYVLVFKKFIFQFCVFKKFFFQKLVFKKFIFLKCVFKKFASSRVYILKVYLTEVCIQEVCLFKNIYLKSLSSGVCIQEVCLFKSIYLVYGWYRSIFRSSIWIMSEYI